MGLKEGVIREGPHGSKVENSRFNGFDPKDWEGGRYAEILNMVRGGATNEEIMARHAGVDDNLCEVYRKIVNGTTADFAQYDDVAKRRGVGKMAERRRRMLMMAAAGKTDQEIAIEAGCTVDTVRYTLYGTRYVKKDKGE